MNADNSQPMNLFSPNMSKATTPIDVTHVTHVLDLPLRGFKRECRFKTIH